MLVKSEFYPNFNMFKEFIEKDDDKNLPGIISNFKPFVNIKKAVLDINIPSTLFTALEKEYEVLKEKIDNIVI